MARLAECPACGKPTGYLSGCRCGFEKQVCAHAGVDQDEPLTRAVLVKLNRSLRAADESDLYPIRGRFNATERAIRRRRRFVCANGEDARSAFAYLHSIHGELSRIVNDPENL